MRTEFFGAIDKNKDLVNNPNTVTNRCKLLEDEIALYKKANAEERVSSNSGLPPSLPKKSALLYQTRLEN